MRVLTYSDLDPAKITGFAKLKKALEADRFDQADVRKIGDNLYRARLNLSDRMLFSLYRYQGETYCLLLEYIRKHAYDRSRFLSGEATIDEDKIPLVDCAKEAVEAQLTYVNPKQDRFHLLDKIISFDVDQHEIYQSSPPLVIVGSAGSGKTALMLEKTKQAIGDVLYVSLSPYLVHNSRQLYFSNGYENDAQEVEFLAFYDFLASFRVPKGKEITARDFYAWFRRQPKSKHLRDGHKLYEEFRGVLTGSMTDKAWLSREDYLTLGVKQSIFTAEERDDVYSLFERYLAFLEAENRYDANLLSYEYLALAQPRYDFIVVDEVQDLTSIQLYLILKSLRTSGQFMLCGDSNQIVHPNFFSWSKVKSLFFNESELLGGHEVVRILHSNYRNAPVVTGVANQILKLKHARFGSVDRESNYLVRSSGDKQGELQLLEDKPETKRSLNTTTARSARYAVLVMHEEQKAAARQWFDTPLIFSVQEAKGLEYDNIILYNFISDEASAFREIAKGVNPEDLEVDELRYARSKDKQDKSLEIYKFFINALYVAITRAVKRLYLIESEFQHPAMKVLQLDRFTGELNLQREDSSIEDWQKEAHKLELQGKDEQAKAIREQVLQQKEVPWPVLDREAFAEIQQRALSESNKKVRLQALEYALLNSHLPTIQALAQLDFKPAQQPESKAVEQLNKNQFLNYTFKNPGAVLRDLDKYGVDHRTHFNLTPLMVAARLGHAELVEILIDRGATPALMANNGMNALQMALEQAVINPQFARNQLAAIYPRLMDDDLAVQVDGRLIMIKQQSMEYFLLNLLSSLFYRYLGPALSSFRRTPGFSAGMLAECVAQLPERVLTHRRKRRDYITSILSKNEIHRDHLYNRKLFLRMDRGFYVVNPQLQLRIEGTWYPYYQLFCLDDLGVRPSGMTASLTTLDYQGVPILEEKKLSSAFFAGQFGKDQDQYWIEQQKNRLNEQVSYIKEVAQA